MGIKFGEIDASQILTNEYKIGVLEKLIDWLLQNSNLKQPLTKEILKEIRINVIKNLQRKYPKSGVRFKYDS